MRLKIYAKITFGLSCACFGFLSSVIYLSVHLFDASYGFHKYQKIFNPIQDGPIHGCSGMEEWGGKKAHPL